MLGGPHLQVPTARPHCGVTSGRVGPAASFPPSLFLFRLGLAPQIHDLYGKVTFTGKPSPLPAHPGPGRGPGLPA